MVNTLNKTFLRFPWELIFFFIEKTGKLQLTPLVLESQWVHSYRRKGERIIMFAFNKWWRYCRYRCYFYTVLTIVTISLPVEIIQPMLIVLNYRSKHVKRRWYIYKFQVNPLTHCYALSSKTFYSTPYYFLSNTYWYSLWVN